MIDNAKRHFCFSKAEKVPLEGGIITKRKKQLGTSFQNKFIYTLLLHIYKHGIDFTALVRFV